MTPAVPHSRSASQVSLLSDVEAPAPGAADGDARASDDLETRFIDTPSRVESEPTLPRRRWYAVALLTVTSAFLYADQNLLSPNLSAVAEEFGFDDREKDLYLGGYLQLAFFVVGAPASLIIGWLADKTPRVRLLAVVLRSGGPYITADYPTTRGSTLTYNTRRVRRQYARASLHYTSPRGVFDVNSIVTSSGKSTHRYREHHPER